MPTPAAKGSASVPPSAKSVTMEPTQLEFKRPVGNNARRQGQFAHLSANVDLNFVASSTTSASTWQDQTRDYIAVNFPNMPPDEKAEHSYRQEEKVSLIFLDGVEKECKACDVVMLVKRKPAPYRYNSSIFPRNAEAAITIPTNTNTQEEDTYLKNHWEPFKSLKKRQIPVTTYVKWLIFENTALPGVLFSDTNIHEQVAEFAKDVFNSALVLLKSSNIDIGAMLDMDDAEYGDEIQFTIFPGDGVWTRSLKVIAELETTEAAKDEAIDAQQGAASEAELFNSSAEPQHC
ncbi:hypothetical protein BU25DRAFT_425691 [Macroventuria anomochaeta]|uniref:Uncharacterized protein n=1 Tax=Macroventuria anomochaeta TaxID=301207 RepID=A0ACB6RNN4_9PLEO|nr:uncharacterized protein BU25DRAFT_425691 [Macroventuria anomochaeta]KAF2622524.1 hypothetical protein BU25DRAFT_425691 [Macroventuria anomochaeta]